jgi:Domain of unknown function (DUF3854)
MKNYITNIITERPLCQSSTPSCERLSDEELSEVTEEQPREQCRETLASALAILKPVESARGASAHDSAPSLEKPLHIEQPHWDEWVERSCISPEITSATLVSADNHKTIREFIGWGQYPKNKHPLGWIAYSGEFDGSRSKVWGQFKPDRPINLVDRKTGESKPTKYITPIVASGIEVQQDCIIAPIRIADQWNVILGDVSIPVAITEGFKKLCTVETQGTVCCGLIGVNRWHKKGEKHKLYPKLKALAISGRTFEIYFDSDWQHNPLVRGQMLALADVLENRNCNIVIKTWDYSDSTKGIDDLIFAYPDTWREHVRDMSTDELRKVIEELEVESLEQLFKSDAERESPATSGLKQTLLGTILKNKSSLMGINYHLTVSS